MKNKFKQIFNVGDSVLVIDQSHGWGVVSKGNIGKVAKVCSDGLEVNFQNRKKWFGRYRCFALVESKNK